MNAWLGEKNSIAAHFLSVRSLALRGFCIAARKNAGAGVVGHLNRHSNSLASPQTRKNRPLWSHLACASLARQESQRLIERIADSAANILYLYDIIEQRNVCVSRQVPAILGYTPEEIQEMGPAVLQTVARPDDLLKLLEYTERFDTAKDGDIIETECRMKHASGEWRWLHSRDTVFARTAGGKPQQVLGMAQQQLAVTVARQISLALANLKLHETLQQQSVRHPLTGLFNRRYLEESRSAGGKPSRAKAAALGGDYARCGRF